MKLIVTEKNQTAERIASILSGGKNSKEKTTGGIVYSYMEDDGNEVKIVGMRGHVLQVDFPEEYRVWQKVEPKSLVHADIEKTPKVKSLVTMLTRLARQATEVVIATDYDREGELIGSDIKDLILNANPDARISRARFSALTPTEINEAFSNTDVLDENLAKAGEARQDIDLIWGAALTRFISLASTRLGPRFLSAGRVQSPTLAIIVDREKQRRAFVPEDYWQIKVTCEASLMKFVARHKTERFTNEPEARAAFEKIGEFGTVAYVNMKDRRIQPPAPFNTTAFLTAASSINVPPARAMDVAESLYTRGIISYPRVDNTVYPESLDLHGVLASIRDADEVGPLAAELMKKKSLTATRGKKFSTDHPPLYPTASPARDSLKPVEWKIFELVARRFMATLSGSAHARSTRVDLDINGEPFVARGDVIMDEGFLRFYPYLRKKDEELPSLSEGDTVAIVDSAFEQKQTMPPPRYSEGKLIEKMEEMGLGTKSTRHSIIQGLIERGYAFGSPLKPTETGIAVTQALERHATTVTTPGMTSELEQNMDEIVEGKRSLEGVVDHSRLVLGKIMDSMESQKEEISKEIRDGVRGDAVLGECPDCGGEMRILRAKKSGKRFAGCGGYPECRVTFPLPQKGAIVVTGEKCEECESPRIKVFSKGSRPWELCLDPKCPTKAKPERPKQEQVASTADGNTE